MLPGVLERKRAQELRGKRVGVLCGGLSAERRISLSTGDAIVRALCDRGHDAQRIYVDRDLDLVLRQARIDVAFLALHGRYGEDGCVQGLLELLGIPYTGSDVLASALAMNKVKAKEVFRLRNLPTPTYYVCDKGLPVGEIHGHFGFPAVVKPVAAGSSAGVSIVRDRVELEAACDEAFLFDDQVLVERHIEGMEISVGILGDQALAAIEIIPPAGLYDFPAKQAGRATVHMPARLTPERYRGVLTQALQAHRALGCEGATRVDMIVSPQGNESILELNSIPPMGESGLLARLARHAGLEFGDLVEAVLGGARLRAHARGRHDRRLTRRPFDGPERRDAAEPH